MRCTGANPFARVQPRVVCMDFYIGVHAAIDELKGVYTCSSCQVMLFKNSV